MDELPPAITHPEDVAALVAALPLPESYTVAELSRACGHLMDTTIVVQPYPESIVAEANVEGRPLPSGVLLNTAKGVHIFYRSDTSAMHQRHVILHELGHLLCRHPTATVDEPATDLNTANISQAAQRSHYHSDRERAAELFAYLVEQRGGQLSLPGRNRRDDPTHADMLRRFRSTFEG
ncbi:ImmA/IrrE family metallo-endopeptidase [Kutzneria buriramensis]|uniref:Uncharacterized protein DUF955 n=1 Tax=Kutzneria buriramensis TaxID=1045776 RepID=A0A3E0HDG2_9PSEU|nr:ImmA/IrrE family metallo-endopeptidase [Kutzneria buriramensis]REH42692.1 uncharacterized protein DUF955 [Kutzneria buriramensis]